MLQGLPHFTVTSGWLPHMYHGDTAASVLSRGLAASDGVAEFTAVRAHPVPPPGSLLWAAEDRWVDHRSPWAETQALTGGC